MIKFATDNDRENIIEMWITAFGDSRESVESFLKYFPCNKALGYYVDDKIVSFMFLLDLELRFKDKSYNANYIYALCTVPEFRFRGYAGALIRFSEGCSARKGIQYTLVRPSTDELFSFYSDGGFEREYRRIKKKLTIDSELLYNNMNNDVSDVAFAQWGNDGLDYALACGIDDEYYLPIMDKSKGERYLMLRRNFEGTPLFENVYMGLTFE